MSLNSIEEAVEDIRQGKMVILVDDEDRENEGDLVMAAEKVTPDAINFMARNGRGLICLTLTQERVEELNLQPMSRENTAPFGTAFTVSIDAMHGITTGISAADRAITILASINPLTRPDDLARPGHIFPIKAQKGGVLKRAGQTEGSVDLAILSGLYPAGVICEIMNEDGSMARLPELIKFAKANDLKIITVKDLIEYRLKRESFVKQVESSNLNTEYGDFRIIVYEDDLEHNVHLVLVKGDIKNLDKVLVRVHSGCITGDIFKSKRCDCGEQLHKAIQMIEREGAGVLLYINRDIKDTLIRKVRSYRLQDEGKEGDHIDYMARNNKPVLREYGVGAQILVDLGVKHIRLMTNNPKKIVGLEGYGLDVAERIPIEALPHADNIDYLKAKKSKLGHLLQCV
ncbi:MAG: bifunctional 3,4-dihydroxy-2-butanone 4-phosphate synthase/GTP cyclohydrolase II [Nitrospirae bacterium RIFCSPLOWO2_02_42_7]|nr:MAG: bifunctional 3,4-dihydroxy-2-butanone 4-phosphate synthase/GTP cyclohydrolase II [Nitrospirae bacterium RIFCSPLOWO2_02_42_7]